MEEQIKNEILIEEKKEPQIIKVLFAIYFKRYSLFFLSTITT